MDGILLRNPGKGAAVDSFALRFHRRRVVTYVCWFPYCCFIYLLRYFATAAAPFGFGFVFLARRFETHFVMHIDFERMLVDFSVGELGTDLSKGDLI